MMLHLIKFQHLPHLSIDKWSTILTYNSMRHPKLDDYIFFNEFVTAPSMALRIGIASTHLVKYSVAISIHMYPWEGGLTGPTKSSPQVWKGHGMTMLCKPGGWNGSNWLAPGNYDTFSQNLLYPFS